MDKGLNDMTSNDLILTIDNGTQSMRALLFDLKGNLVAQNKIPLTAYFSNHPGWAEQEADYFWQKLAQACQELWQDPDVIKHRLKERIVAVTLTTQRGTVINLDKNGQALRPTILWLDQRLCDLSAENNNKLNSMPWY